MKNFFLAMMIVMMSVGLAMAQKTIPTEQTIPAQAAAQVQNATQPQAPAEDDSFTLATVSGEISGITKKGISVIYDRDYDAGTEYEIMVLVDNKTKFKHKKDLSELKVGDLISVEYEKAGEKSKHKGMATTINFVQSGVTSLATKDTQSLASDGEATP